MGSQTNSKKYGEKYPKQVCQQNLYPMFNHDNYKSQSQYDHFEAHTFTNLTWPSAPSDQLTCLLQIGIMN